MVKRAVSIHTRWDISTLDEIDTLVLPEGKYKNTSEAIRECTKIGMKVLHHQEMMKDPKQANEFQQKMQEMIKTENYQEWLETLQTGQLDGFIMLKQLEKEKRYEQTKFY